MWAAEGWVDRCLDARVQGDCGGANPTPAFFAEVEMTGSPPWHIPLAPLLAELAATSAGLTREEAQERLAKWEAADALTRREQISIGALATSLRRMQKVWPPPQRVFHAAREDGRILFLSPHSIRMSAVSILQGQEW